MSELSFTYDQDAWSAHLSNETFPDLDIRIQTDGPNDPPTEIQMRAAQIIQQMSPATRDRIAAVARQWGEYNIPQDEQEIMEDEDWEYEITYAVVPPLRSAADAYIIFAGHTEMEMEHGLGCITKNGDVFAICHSDFAYSGYEWDAVARFEAMLNE